MRTTFTNMNSSLDCIVIVKYTRYKMTRRKTREGSVNVEQLTARARTLSAHNTQSNLIDEVITT